MTDSSNGLLLMRDIVDNQLMSHDDVRIGRVASVEADWREDGSLVLEHLVAGPQALLGRFSMRLEPIARFIFRNRFEHQIPLTDIEDVGPTIKLKKNADEYAVGESDRWIARHILRFIPGSGA